MKKEKLLYGALGLAILGLTGCSGEEPINGNGQVAQKDEVRYLRVAIANPPQTRAEFQDGTPAENLVKSMEFRFYDVNGNFIKAEPMQTEDTGGEFEFTPVTPGNGSVGKIREFTYQIQIQRGSNYPSYVMCFINPVSYGEITGDNSMYDLRNEIRENYKDNAGNFAMDNSVYYGNDPVSGANMVKISGTPILATQLKTSKDEADNATDPVEIYVERYAAKVNFTLKQDEGAIKTVTTENGGGAYSLTFVPEAWTINADAQSMYVVKRYENTDAATDEIPTFNQVNTMLQGWSTWNDKDNCRSYWACSPGFYATEFPTVSDDIIDKAETGTGAGVPVAPYKLCYYSYNQITSATSTSDGKGVTAFNNGGSNWKYVLENTMGKAAFGSLNPKAAAPSVLIVGHYNVTNAGGQAVNNPDGFCIYNNRLYFRNNVPAGANANSITIEGALLNANQILAVDENGALLNNNNSNLVKNYFEVVHPSKAVRGTQVVPHRYVTLQLKKAEDLPALTGLYYKPVGSDNWVSLNEGYQLATDKQAFIDNINRMLWQQLGVCRAYTQNKCYFSIPIQHLGFTENTGGEPVYENGQIDWAKVRVGDFGLVRNHVYNIQVDGIDGWATGIEDLNNPIVPSMEENDYFIRYKINILNWRIVPEQTGIILK